jgi:hypothetical protein
VSDDHDRIRRMQERLARIHDENEAADALAGRRRLRDEAEITVSVSPARRPGRRRGLVFIAALLLTTVVFGELALTVQGWSAPDFDDARRVGAATVVSCERRGPVGLGIGYWDRCTADIVWEGGLSERHTFDRRSFFDADDVGTTVTIGEGTGFRGGGTTYSRPDLPHRPWAVALGVVLAVIAAIPALLLFTALFFAIRDSARKIRER